MKEIRYRWRGAAFCLALSLMAAGCSMTDDVECPPDGGDTPGMSDAFIQLSFGMADAQGTRANPDGGETGDGPEPGQDAENIVSTAVAFLFDGNVTVNGSFDAWTDGGIAMTAVEGEDKAYTATLEGVNAPGKVEFQFRVKNGTDIKYVGATAGEDGSQPNLVLNLLPADDGTTKAYTGTIATGVALAA